MQTQPSRRPESESLVHALGMPFTTHEDRVIIYKRPLGRYDAYNQLEDALTVLTGGWPGRDPIKTLWGDF